MGGFAAIHAAGRDPGLCAVVAICPAPEDVLLRVLRRDGPRALPLRRAGHRGWLESLDLYER